MKKCNRCCEVKSLDEFGKQSSAKDGKRARCRTCIRAAKAAYARTDKGKAARAKWAKTEKGRANSTRTNKRLKATDRYKERTKAYRRSSEGKAARRRYEESDKGKANQLACHRRQQAKPDFDDKRRLHCHARRARIANAPSDNWKASEVHGEANGKCLYCGISVTISEMHADHFIPIAKGGSNLRENIVCSCASCNLKKGAKMPEDFVGETL